MTLHQINSLKKQKCFQQVINVKIGGVCLISVRTVFQVLVPLTMLKAFTHIHTQRHMRYVWNT